MVINELGQPVGEDVAGWAGAEKPGRPLLEGRWCRLERLDAGRHGNDLFAAWGAEPGGPNFTYLSYEPFASDEACQAQLRSFEVMDDPFFYAIIDRASGRALGMLAFMRIDPKGGAIEVGHVHFGKALQKSRLASEAVYLMMREAFEGLHYRRFEWKCDALNAGSKRAAERFGFTYEGTFREATVYKGRSRDTAWFSIVEEEWLTIRAAFEAWLDPANFDGDGRQVRRLEAIRAELGG